MKMLKLLAVAFFLLPTSMALECFVGKNNDLVLTAGFDYCSTALNRATLELSYSGHNGLTDVFDKEASDLSKSDCFANLPEATEMRCYCKKSECNFKVTKEEFDEIVFDHHSDYPELVNHFEM